MPSRTNSLLTDASQNLHSSARWTLFARLGSQLLSLVTMMVVARVLSPDQVGLAAVAFLVMSVLDNIADFGVLSALIQRNTLTYDDLSGAFWFLAVAGTVICLLLAVTAVPLAAAFGEPDLAGLLRVLAVTVLTLPIQATYRALLSRAMRLDTVAAAEIVSALLRSALSVLLAWYSRKPEALVYGYLAERVCQSFYLMAKSDWRPRISWKIAEGRQLLTFGLQVTASRLLWFGYVRADSFAVASLLGAAALGPYSLAYQIPNAIYQLTATSFQRVVFPLLSARHHAGSLLAALIRSSRLLSLVTLPLFAVVAQFADKIILTLYGTQWDSAVLPLRALALVAALQTMMTPLPLAMNAVGRPGANVIVNLFSAIGALGGSFLGAYLLGLHGILAALMLVSVSRAVALAFLVSKAISVPTLSLLLVNTPALVSTLAMASVISGVREITDDQILYLQDGIAVFVGCMVYVLIHAAFDRQPLRDAAALVRGALPSRRAA